jgi:acetate kinase
MNEQRTKRILTINSGSSSVKFALYHMGDSEALALSGSVERIGLRASRFTVQDANGEVLADEHDDLPDHDAAFRMLFKWLETDPRSRKLDAVGHRVVHGGPDHRQPQMVTIPLVARLAGLVSLASDHLPHEIKAIRAVDRIYPGMKQVACFDTAFHRDMPALAQIYALPRHYERLGVIRYGFHGLSYEYIMQELRKEAGPEVADGRVIIAHLGNGASMAAVRGGKGVETTMGLTPTGGLVMSTRSGDLDPGVVLYLLEDRHMRVASARDLLTEHAGLLAVSGVSSDMKDLLDLEKRNAAAAEAVALFCYQAKKYVGALAAALGGLDTFIFTAGIGENAPAIRWRICEGLEFLGIRLDAERNDGNAAVISRDDSPVTVRVMKTNEDLMIARHTYAVITANRQ